MKKLVAASMSLICIGLTKSYAQDIKQSDVPSVVVNSFEKAFPKAMDVEWELKGDLYKVEFETGATERDHSAWYSKTGELKKHKEDITKNELPKAVLAKIAKDYSGFTVDDCDKYTADGKSTYKVELDSATQEWKITFDANGVELKKVND